MLLHRAWDGNLPTGRVSTLGEDAISGPMMAMRPPVSKNKFCAQSRHPGVSLAMGGGRRDEAIGHLEKALEIRPDHPLAWEAPDHLRAGRQQTAGAHEST
jgi:hypothetical protein